MVDLPGKCIGWHKLTEEQYRQKLADYNEKQRAKEHGGPCGAEPHDIIRGKTKVKK